MARSLMAALLVLASLSGCAQPLARPVGQAPLPAQAATVKKAALGLDAAKLRAVGFTNRYMEVNGDAGAITGGDGIWMSFGRLDKPAEGWERPANADGSFKQIILDLKVPETVTFWSWRDEGDKRFYSAPVTIAVTPPKAAGAARRPR